MTTTKRTKKRAKPSIFPEIMEGLRAVKDHVAGKITLRKTVREDLPAIPELAATEIRTTREKLGLSQAVFAARLCTKKRTLEQWEQGRTKPNDQAAALIRLVQKYPDTIERLAKATM